MPSDDPDPKTAAHDPAATAPHQPSDSTGDAATFDGPGFGAAETLPARPSQLGTVIAGRYTLAGVIGEGGMGSVYLAEQTEPVKRQVALKLIKAGMDSKTVLARFDSERQALALMDHPNIARIYDGGVTGTGQPFFAMELVRGVPLTAYCDQHKLPVPARLELFVSVCQAVQHAHQKGIIHRDLKPGNVLVTEVDGRPTPKVIDFGVAKATEQKLTDMSFADVGMIVGTPAYMSPEQADPSSVDIDTRTDVYALGVILYELLVGSLPLETKQFQRGAVLEMLRMVREVEPPRPSTKLSAAENLPNIAANRGVEPLKLAKDLRGELDWVVMKALEKDRTRRYDSAMGLAQDVQRYLTDEVVEARPPSTAYRVKKFVRRNKGPVAAVAVVLLALCGGIVGTGVGLYRANAARDAEAAQRIKAEDATAKETVERKRAEDVATLMESVFEGIDPDAEQERGLTFKDQLVAKIDHVTRNTQNFAGDPAAQARFHLALGRTLHALGEYPRAEQLLKSAAELGRREFGPDDERTLQAEYLQAAACQMQGRFDEALALIEGQRGRSSGKGEHDHTLGMIHRAAGRLDKAIPLLHEAYKQLPPGPDTTGTLLKRHTLGAVYREAGRVAEAIPVLEDVHARRAKLFGPDHSDTLMSANSLAVAYSEGGQAGRALKLYEDTRQRLLKRYAPDHPSVLNCDTNLAQTMSKMGRLADAIAKLEEARDRAVAKLGANSLETLRIQSNLAVAHFNSAHYDAAREIFETILPPLTAAYGPESWFVTQTHANLARCLRNLGRDADAVRALDAALVKVTKKHGPDHPNTLNLRAELALLQRDTEAEKAVEAFADVLARQTKVLGEKHPDLIRTRYGLGCAYFSARRAKEAIATFEEVLPRQTELLGPDHPETLRTRSSLGAAYWGDKQFDRSVPHIEETLRKELKVLGPDAPGTLSTAENLAINYDDSKQPDKLYEHSKVWLHRLMMANGPQNPVNRRLVTTFVRECQTRGRMADAVPVMEILHDAEAERLGPNHAGTMQAKNNLAAAYWSAGRLDRSIPLLEEVVRFSKKDLGDAHPAVQQRVGSLARNYIDAGRAKEAVALLTEALRYGRAGKGELPADLDFLHRDLVQALAQAGEREKTLAEAKTYVEEARRRLPANSPLLASGVATVGMSLADVGAFAEAEPLLREGLAIREKVTPQSWLRFNTQSLLGGALLGQKKYADAEPMLVKGYEGLREQRATIPPAAAARIPEALDRLVELYAATNQPVEVKKWRDERAKYPTVAPPPRAKK
jgi:tetratricopeptide (TPR) repeat protein